MLSQINAVFESQDDKWIGYVVEIPELKVEGGTLEEARENLKDKVRKTFIQNRDTLALDTKGHRLIKEEIRLNL